MWGQMQVVLEDKASLSLIEREMGAPALVSLCSSLSSPSEKAPPADEDFLLVPCNEPEETRQNSREIHRDPAHPLPSYPHPAH